MTELNNHIKELKESMGLLPNNDPWDRGYLSGVEDGFRAALKWVKREAISLDERGNTSRVIINRELEDK